MRGVLFWREHGLFICKVSVYVYLRVLDIGFGKIESDVLVGNLGLHAVVEAGRKLHSRGTGELIMGRIGFLVLVLVRLGSVVGRFRVLFRLLLLFLAESFYAHVLLLDLLEGRGALAGGLEEAGALDLNLVQSADFLLASSPGRRLVVVLGRRAAHRPVRVPEQVPGILVHVVLLRYVRALDRAVFESVVASALWTAHIPQKLSADRIGRLGAVAEEGAGAVGRGRLGGRMGNLQSVHARKPTRKDFAGGRREEIHFVVIRLRLSEGKFRVRWRCLRSQELFLRRALGETFFCLLLGYRRLETGTLFEEGVGSVDIHPTRVRLVVCGTCHFSYY